MESAFLRIVSEIEAARVAGFVRPALYESLALIDLCGKVEFRTDNTGARFKDWVKMFLYDEWLAYTFWHIPVKIWTEGSMDEIVKCVQKTSDIFADELYQLRCNLFHEGTADNRKDRGDKKRVVALRLYKITALSSVSEAAVIKNLNEPYQYQPVDIGVLITKICHAVKMYYESSSQEIKEVLDKTDKYLIDERSDDFFEQIGRVWTIETLNERGT